MKDIISKGGFVFSLLGAKLRQKNAPLFVFFTITNKCNAACSYCFGNYYQRYNDEKDKELNTKQIFSIIDELAVSGTQRVGISGGDPLVREDVGEIVSYIKSKGIGCGLNTNGFLIADKIEDIKEVDNITISLDGDKEAHEANRGKGTYDKVMEAIKIVKAHKIPLHLSAVITKSNMHSIDYVMEFAKKIGSQIQISPLYNCFWGGEGKKDFPQQLSKDELIKTTGKIISYKKKGYPVFYSYKTYENILNWPDYNKDRIIGEEPDFEYAKCYMGRFICTIDANGDVYPCAQVSGFDVKNCVEVGFKEAFDNIARHDCKACRWACYNEYNLLFAFHPSAIVNTIKNSFF